MQRYTKTNTERPERTAYSIPEAAQRLGVGPTTVRRRVTDGTLPATKLGRLWLIPAPAVDQFAKAVAR